MPLNPDAVGEPRRCNPLVIHPKGDTPGWGAHPGRYEVYCGACGPDASTFADTYREAKTLAAHHVPNPGGVAFTDPAQARVDDRLRDWSESALRMPED